MRRRALPLLLILLLAALGACAQSLQQFEKSVTEFTLANGMHFIVVERHEVPIVSFDLYVDVGSVDENLGQGGIAHLFEHLAFKGTSRIGTRDYAREKKALAALDQAYDALDAERAKGEKADQARLKQLEEVFERAQAEADKFVLTDQFSQIIDRAGGVGLNAATSDDATRYFFSLPSNKLELWFSLESDRFLDPVIRDFYKERDVVMEERRMRTDSQPVGRLYEDFLGLAFKAHPYGRPTIGYPSELMRVRRSEAKDYFHRHYVASALTAAIVGDVDPKEMRRLAEIYFGRLPQRPRPQPLRIREPEQDGERRVTIEAQAQPYLIIGYHRPDVADPGRVVFDVISDILSEGRTSWLYTSLVKEKQIAVEVEAGSGLPGMKYPNLFVVVAVPAAGHTNAEVEKAIEEQLERLKTEKISGDALEQAKRRARASVLRGLRSNSGLAAALNDNYVLLGDWRYLFRDLDATDKVTAEDVRRVAGECFQKKNRTVGELVPAAPAAQKKAPVSQ
jgi:predicted Zn-dependent peptidase